MSDSNKELETAKSLVNTMNFIKKNWIILALLGLTQTPVSAIKELVTGEPTIEGNVVAAVTKNSEAIATNIDLNVKMNSRITKVENILLMASNTVNELGQLQKEFTELMGSHLRNPEIHKAGLNVLLERIKSNKEDIKELKDN